jgi:NhaP-type Na+/H+ or K+/H+ antiporter
MNNGLAPVLVLWVLGTMGLPGMDSQALSSLSLLAAWGTLGGFLGGWLIGAVMARVITVMDPERQTDFLEETVVFATPALAYAGALAMRADGFLAVFAAGVALCHGGRLRHPLRNRPLMPRVLRIAGALERAVWLAVFVLVGALIAGVEFHARMLVFALVLLLLIRPLAVRMGLGQLAVSTAQWGRLRGPVSAVWPHSIVWRSR